MVKVSKTNNNDWVKQASILSQALPFMQKYSGKNITIKYGGAAMGENNLSISFAKDIALLKQVGINPVVVHGGGPRIKLMLDRLKVKSSFVDGLRITDKETMKIVEMVLSGSINKEIVMEINKEGGRAIGLSGKDALLAETIKLEKKESTSEIEKVLDLGFVGYPNKINEDVLKWLLDSDFIPVLSSMCIARPKAPTPGRISLSNVGKSSGIETIFASPPAILIAFKTDFVFPIP